MNSTPPTPLSISDRVALGVASGLGVGFIPVAPGTWGSLWAFPLAWGLLKLNEVSVWAGPGAALLLLLVGVAVCERTARLMKLKDPAVIVFDEYAALALVYFTVPLNWQSAVLGFVVFRIFDTLKPWPLHRLEHLPHGWGIVADDLGAAACTAGVLTLTFRYAGLS
jgi:phosphatidylglycerophosphatase A